jgi:hypothetical protein
VLTGWDRICGACSRGYRSVTSRVLCVEEFLPKHYAEAGRASSYEGEFYFTAVAGRSQGVEDSSFPEEEEASGAGREPKHSASWRVRSPPNDQPDSSRASAKPTSWLARANPRSPQTGALRLARGPRLCPRVHRQSRANKLFRAAGKSVRPRVGRRTRLS